MNKCDHHGYNFINISLPQNRCSLSVQRAMNRQVKSEKNSQAHTQLKHLKCNQFPDEEKATFQLSKTTSF